VKVQRPDIRMQMKATCTAQRRTVMAPLGVCARWTCPLLEQFSSNVLGELDYTGEAYNAHRLI
jgi:predicted unusual protein kinase regulating ubiquinone biosynthesis (AarF/ABC1/UbiB family)